MADTQEPRFDACLTQILKHEGGYVDHPRDPGGATNRGITRKVLASWRNVSPWWQLPKSDVKKLTRREAADIYRARFWKRAGADLPAGLDLALFDYAVNSGPVRAVKALQGLVGVRRDGKAGPLTRQAIEQKIHLIGLAGLIMALCDQRLNFLTRLATFTTFGRGWSRRVAEIRKAALAAAGASDSFVPSQNQTQRKDPMQILAGYRTYIIAAIMLLTGLAQLLGISVPAFDAQSAGQLVMEALAVIFLRRGLKTEISNA